MRACSVCRVCRTAPQRVGRGFVFNIRCRDGDTVHHVEHIPRSQPASQSEKSISGDRSLLDISSHRGNVHSDRALLAPLSESVGRMDRFRRNLGACRSRNTLNSIDLAMFKRFSMICYLGMGWMIVLCAKLTYLAIGVWGCVFLIGGGVFYTVGSVLYLLGKKSRQKIHTFGIPSVRRFRKHNAHVHDSFLHSIKRHEI